MKKELITELFEKFEHACCLYNEVECWSARELQEIFGYVEVPWTLTASSR